MFKIIKESIKPLAADEGTYYRGLRYYKEHAVASVTWSKANQQYRAAVKGGSQYTVTIDLNEKGEIGYNCNCPAHIKYEGACKHVVAALLFIEHYQERTEGKQPETEEEKTVYQILDYFDQQEKGKLFGDSFRVKVHIEVPELLKNKVTKAYVSLSAGGTRLYKVSNIKRFLQALRDGQDYELGKEFKYIHGESRFLPRSQRILDYLIELYEVQEALGGGSGYFSLFSKAVITFTKPMLIRLLQALEKNAFSLTLSSRVYENVEVYIENPPVCFELKVTDNRIQMTYPDEIPVIPVAEDGSMLFYGKKLYLPDKDFIINYVPFYQNLGNNKGPLCFSGEQKDKFIEKVLPRIHETMKIAIPENLKDKFVQEPLKKAFYLDKYKLYIKGEIRFQYGTIEIDPISGETPRDVIVIRDRLAEMEFLEELESLHFIQGKEGFFLKKEEDIYSFLSQGLESLKGHCELYYSNDFKHMSLKPAGTLHSQIRLSEDNRLLELTLSYDEIPMDELRELYRSLKIRKKYYRLKDGSFVLFSDRELEHSSVFFEKLNISGKDMTETGIRLPVFAAPYVEYLSGRIENLDVRKEHSYEELIDHILNPDQQEYLVPDTVTGNLRNYQITGYRWLKSLASNGLGGILADDMGLGKTLQAITYMASFQEKERINGKGEKMPYLIVCPASLIYNWLEEFQTFAPNMRCIVISGPPESRMELLKNRSGVDVVIISYPLLRRDIEAYGNISFHTMFIDEAQFIKNAGSQNAKCVKQIHAEHRFALTGTPIENSLSELWSIFDYVMPGFFLSHSRFSEQYEKPVIREGNKEVLEELLGRIQPFILRRMKKDVLKELPEKIESKVIVELTEEQRKVYLAYLSQMKNELFQGASQSETGKMRLQVLSALTRLRQICCHPATFIHNYKGTSGKMDSLMELVEKILEGGHRILIFSQFTSVLAIIEKEFDKQKLEYFSLKGTTKVEERLEAVRRFNDGERSVFLISLKAGGTGLNLTGADTVIHFDPWWNPAAEEQATDRAYRIGQKSSVQVIRLIAKDTIEEKIYKLQQKKKELAGSVIQSGEVFVNYLSREELEEIFRMEC